MRAVPILVVVSLLACSSKKDPPATTGSSAAEPPPKGSAAEPPKGSAAEPPKGSAAAGSGSADAGSGSGSAVAAGSGSDAGSAAGSAAPTFDFDKLTHDQKMDFMKKQVVPKMKPLFQKFDAKEFANFGCKTCHGKDPQKTKYEMPSSDVPALDWAALKAGKQKPEMAKWMSDVVKPEMAKLLNEPEMSDTQPKGFGCLHCHTQKK